MSQSRLLVVWYNPSKDLYYYKIVSILYSNKEGYTNSYGHKIVLMIPITFQIKGHSLRKRIIRYIIAFLERFI